MSAVDLIDAAFDGDLNEVRRLISVDPSIVNRGNGKNGAIHSAASNDQAEVISLLLDHGADIDVIDEDGMTPLHRAAEGQQLRAARVLIERGADLDSFDPKGYTPVALALVGQSDSGFELAKLLFQSGAKRGLIDACLLAEIERVQDILDRNMGALSEIPSHEMLLSGTIAVDRGSLEDRVRLVDLLFAYGLKPDREFVRQQISSLGSSNMRMFIPALVGYAGNVTA